MGLQVWLNFLVDDRAGPVWLNYRQQYTTILEKSTDENKHGMMSIEEHRKLIKNRENRMNNGNTRTYQVQVSPAKQTATRQRGEEAEYVVPQSSLNLVSSFLTFTFLTTFSPSSHSPLPPPLLTAFSDRIPLFPRDRITRSSLSLFPVFNSFRPNQPGTCLTLAPWRRAYLAPSRVDSAARFTRVLCWCDRIADSCRSQAAPLASLCLLRITTSSPTPLNRRKSAEPCVVLFVAYDSPGPVKLHLGVYVVVLWGWVELEDRRIVRWLSCRVD